MPIIRRLVQGMSLEDRKKLERPKFETPPVDDPMKQGFVAIRTSSRTKSWNGYFKREGFRWSNGRRQWVYDQHDDGSRVSLEEATWIADRIREMVAGDVTVYLGSGLYVEPLPEAAPAFRRWRSARS